MRNAANHSCSLPVLACLALLWASGLQPACAHAQSLGELARQSGELRFALCASLGDTLEDECASLDEETVWILHDDGRATLRSETVSAEQRACILAIRFGVWVSAVISPPGSDTLSQ